MLCQEEPVGWRVAGAAFGYTERPTEGERMGEADSQPHNEGTSVERAQQRPQPAPAGIGIAHLLLYMLTSAIYAGWARLVLGENALLVGLFPWGLSVVLAGLLLFGTAVSLTRWVRSPVRTVEPGQWLVLGHGIPLMLVMCAWTVANPMSVVIFEILPRLIGGAVFFVGSRGANVGRGWRVCLSAFALVEASRPFLDYVETPDIEPITFAALADLALVGLLIAAVIADARGQRERTFLHWVGIVASCGLAGMRLVGWL